MKSNCFNSFLIKLLTVLFVGAVFGASTGLAQDWIHLTPDPERANGKKIVFVTGDDEYKSETSMPMMAHILAEYHGFDCRVLFAINRQSGVIDTNQRDHIPGLEYLQDADLMVIFTRFRTLVDEQMQMIEDYLETGKPVIGLRTATHAFDFSKVPDHNYAKYGYSNKSEDFVGGFGRQVLGETWIRHWGHHGKQSTRGRFAAGQENHPILTGIADGEMWGPTDVYETSLPLPEGCVPIVMGEVCETMSPDSGPAPAPPADAKGRQAIDKNKPMMPVSWTWQRDRGVKGRVFTSTFGGAMAGKDDWASAGTRRMFVNACFWTLGMEDQIPAKANVTPVLSPNPFKRGVKPQDALKQGLATKAKKDRGILFYGNSMVERLLEQGELEARLQIANADEQLMIRSLAWTGDEVGNRLRLEKYATHMKNLLAEWPANTIILGYGLNEAFAGQDGLEEFKAHYKSHLAQLSKSHSGAGFVLLSPIAPATGDEELNKNVKLYSDTIAAIAASVDAKFIDLYTPTSAAEDILLRNGIHLNDKGNQLIAGVIAKQLSIDTENLDAKHLAEVTKAAAAKHKRVAEVVRPKNAVVYFGVRARPKEYAEEMPRYHEMIRQTEAVVQKLASDSSLSFADQAVPSLPPLEERTSRDDGDRTGIIKSVAENQAEFEVADGYKVNLFASEEQFPELRNPVQIAFDARGRLWVVTMPSFPHTVPGLTPPDKILIFEDTDKDGKADKVTTFAEGLDALDGVAFHRNGVIISEQPRLWLMQDTNGDDVADTRQELIRGIDVTDSHHGGMIASDPFGDVIFSDGVFHRSQFETPFGVHRGIDASTYRLDPMTGRLHTEFQHTTPNPWNVAFSKYGGIFPMYGDGDVYDGTSLIWTPLGAYQPYAYGRMTSYGKGSGNAMISSSNFPDKYQQGMASASLLGRYAVNITELTFDDGMAKQKSHETILSSPNAAFRPADLEFGMDGALYVSDFCSPIIGHAQHPMRSPHWDHDYGRIWRIVHTEKPTVKEWPTIEGASNEELCKLLLHDQDLVRHHARIEFRKNVDRTGYGPNRTGYDLGFLDAWIGEMDQSSPEYLQAALEVIFVCEGLGETRPELLKQLLKSDDPLYRGAAIQALRLQADRIDNVAELLKPLVSDSHPRVLIEVIDAVAHLRPEYPELEAILEGIDTKNKHVAKSLETLDYGVEPVKGRSVPVLEIDPSAQLKVWGYLGENGKNAPATMEVGRDKLPGAGLFRTFVEADEPTSAIIGINNKNLVVKLNGAVEFEQNSFWSGDQQINVDLKPGLNTIEVLLRKGRRAAGSMPPVYLYDPVGQALSTAKYSSDKATFASYSEAYDQMIAERGNLVSIQAVAGLQFSPKELSVTPGSKVRLSFTNPDIMMHNWVLIKPGTADAIGKLADELAASGKGVEKEYLPDSDDILVASKLLGPKGEQELVFTAPEEPGEYPYVCTFPGHWRLMQGVLKVEKPEVDKSSSTDRNVHPTKAPSDSGGSKRFALSGTSLVETADSPDGFKEFVPPSQPIGKVETNQATNNDPIAVLTDGKLGRGFGPIFGNGIKDGIYRMDLGKSEAVHQITSWSYNQGGKRGHQTVTVYGSNHPTNPGWNLSDAKRFTNLGTMSTVGKKLKSYTALSLVPKKGVPSLGKFRWIAWQVAPVTGSDENTAFQEFGVQFAKATKVKEKKAAAVPTKKAGSTSRPNVILVMTDDQGWGEVGFNGNSEIKTPHLDQFAKEGLQLSQFYVSPMCTPTRSSLMTGRYHYRTGAHDTYIGRTNMNGEETCIGEVFAGAGYKTGIFGKWHLGENYPLRAQDQGFQDVVVHGGGGLGQFADYPGNGNFNPTVLDNGIYKPTNQYCTDVFIDESIEFIKENKDQPFFCYIPLNAPHAPFAVDQKYLDYYKGLKDKDKRKWTASIWGMISQLDIAFQRLLDAVEEQGLSEDTIIIFTTDNGPNSVHFTGGLKAKKGSSYENGIRVPFAMQWPAKIKGGRKLSDPTMHIDLLPTLAAACGIALPEDLELDGDNVLPLLTGEIDQLDERFLFMQHNRGNLPVKYKNCMVRKGPWKAVGSKGARDKFELYNIDEDPGEKNNLAAQHPDKVKTFVGQYSKWFDDVTAELRSDGGMPAAFELNPAQTYDFRFTWQDWWGEKTGWSSRNYGRWRMTNPGLIERFDVAIRPVKQHRGQASEVKFIWQDKVLSKSFDQTPDTVLFEDIELAEGTGWMEAQLIQNGKVASIQEVQIRPHGVASVYEFNASGEKTKTKSNAKANPKPAVKKVVDVKGAKSIELPEKVNGQFVRIELPGKNRTLSLAEVLVIEKGENVAKGKSASQSSTGYSGNPGLAVDGNANGNYMDGSVTHTNTEANAWWEVDLGKLVAIDEIIIANRTDSHGERLDGFTLTVLDADRKPVFSKKAIERAPAVRLIRNGVKPTKVVAAPKSVPTKAAAQAKSVSGAVSKPSSNKKAHLFILAGQSNMVRVDPEESFAPAVEKEFGKDSVIIVKDAHNGQPIRRWFKKWKSAQGKTVENSGDLYDRLLAKVKAATKGRELETITFLWMQGEADAAGNQVKVYQKSFEGLLNQLRRDLRRDDISFVIGRLSDYSLDNGKHPEWPAMRKLQEDMANASTIGAWVNTDDLNNMEKDGKPYNDVHYTKKGYRIFGERLAEKAIELVKFNQDKQFPGVKTDFRGYVRYDKIQSESGHFSIICPKKPAPGKPWLWRSLFWEAIQQVSNADLKLVDEGYYVVLAHGNVAGHPKGNANIDAAYKMVTEEFGFSKKCSMSSMSRGTLSLFRWASANPEKVDSIYVDNGVCNIASWPAGSLVEGNDSVGTGSKASWEDLKKTFGFATDKEALESKESPIDQLEPLAKAGVPILMVCGDNDRAVPYEENDAIMEKRYQALGGDIEIIIHSRGHSHGMKEPKPILDFIRKHTSASKKWVIDSDQDWQQNASKHSNIEIKDGMASPTEKQASYQSVVKTFKEKQSANSITFSQSPVWHNWEPIPSVTPRGLGDAPVMLTLGPKNYWLFGRFGNPKKTDFKPEPATLEGFDLPLLTTPYKNQFTAPGGLKENAGGYHAWQSRDMVNWVHHGSVTEKFSAWVTTAEYVDGKAYIYYDFPNDQDPHVYVDDDLFDGVPGKNVGMAFKDPSDGSDCTFIRDLNGDFHVIYEDWSPIDASTHSWDSPLAGHAISKTGIGDFKLLDPAVDERTTPTGKYAEFPHPHWHAADPDNYPAKIAPEDVPQHRIKKGEKRAFSKYEIHEPEQHAYGDWASICIGGQYYLFADYHPANEKIRVGWFTSPSIDEQFTFCGEIGMGHPDPDIGFAEGQFYLVTQLKEDYVSPGPWVESVEVRVGVDTDNDATIDQWTDWQEVKESYDYIAGFSKQIAKTPAKLDLSDLPDGYGFQFEVRMSDTTENASKPILDKVEVDYSSGL